ncbi:MAG: MerR family transcriptional regulator [Flavobacteriales bacterium]|nr:MerR family transcriptional regulator [Flavobacteriales bacterium]
MPVIDLEVEKLYYSISEVSELLGVNASLIRFWEKEFVQLAPKKNLRGNRQFTMRDIELLRRIHYLVKERGFTLDGAKKSLRDRSNEAMAAPTVLERLMAVRRELQEIASSL